MRSISMWRSLYSGAINRPESRLLDDYRIVVRMLVISVEFNSASDSRLLFVPQTFYRISMRVLLSLVMKAFRAKECQHVPHFKLEANASSLLASLSLPKWREFVCS